MIQQAGPNISGFKVPLDRIETEFRNIWKQTQDSNGEDMVVKASTLNLVITCSNPETFTKIHNMVPDFTRNHPGRIIMVLMDASQDTAEIDSSISAFCHPQREDGRQICCELVTLRTGHPGDVHLSGILLPLLLPDLPVFFFNPDQQTFTSPEFSLLEKSIERIILDTPATFTDMDAVYTYTDQIINASKSSKISDLKWSQLTPWREALARFFDGQDGQDLLANIDNITITYTGAQISSSALFLAGWLASSLHWDVESYAQNDPLALKFSHHDMDIRVLLESQSEQQHTGDISRVTIRTRGENPVVMIAESEQKTINLTLATDGQQRPLDKLSSPEPSYTWLVGNELDFVRADLIYLASVEMLWNLLHTDKRNVHEIY